MPTPDQAVNIPSSDYELIATRSSGPGGQHVNKVASAIQLRFDIRASSLPDWMKTRLLGYSDKRITQDGIVIIQASQHRSQKKNSEEAVKRLYTLIRKATQRKKKRIRTQPTANANQKRLKAKKRRSEIKKLRGKIERE